MTAHLDRPFGWFIERVSRRELDDVEVLLITVDAVGREARSALRELFAKALPVFVVITFVAALLDEGGVIDALGGVLGPAMAVSLAGVLLPCLVTAFPVAREVSARWALKMMARQATAAIGFSIAIAWFGRAALELL